MWVHNELHVGVVVNHGIECLVIHSLKYIGMAGSMYIQKWPFFCQVDFGWFTLSKANCRSCGACRAVKFGSDFCQGVNSHMTVTWQNSQTCMHAPRVERRKFWAIGFYTQLSNLERKFLRGRPCHGQI
jgi:hypothetical protein